MEDMTQEQKDEAQREKIADEKNKLFWGLIMNILMSAIVAGLFYAGTIIQNPHLSNDFEIALITDNTVARWIRKLSHLQRFQDE